MVRVRFSPNSNIKQWHCYKVKDVAEETGIFEKELLRRGAKKAIDWWVFVDRSGYELKDVLEKSETNNVLALAGRFKLPWRVVAGLVHESKAKVKTLFTEEGREYRVMEPNERTEILKASSSFMDTLPDSSDPEAHKLVKGSFIIGRDELYMLPKDLEELLKSNQQEKQPVEPLERQEVKQGHEKNVEGWDLNGWEEIEKFASKVCDKQITRYKLKKALEKHPGRWKRSAGGVKGNGKRVQGHSAKLRGWLIRYKIF